jgi:nitrogen regulatory protein P-II 1
MNMLKSSLIVTIVRKGWGNTVLEASVQAGAEGGTVLFGRGAGIHEQEKILGIPIEPEKEIVLTVTDSERVDAILEGIDRDVELNEPGRGLAFVIGLDKVVGISHSEDHKSL